VKKFKMERIKKITSITLLIIAVFILWLIWYDDSITTQRFCAYGQVYVEFEHNGHVWGTTFLDEHGHPTSCTEDDTIEKRTSTNTKETI